MPRRLRQRHVFFKMRAENGKALHGQLALLLCKGSGSRCCFRVLPHRCNNHCLCTMPSPCAKNIRKPQKSVAKLWCRRYGTAPIPLGGFCTMKSGYKIGYARVSTDAQETHLQLDALHRAKCRRIYQEKASGAKADRPELLRLLDNARKGDVVIVWKLDRLARSLRQLIDTMALFHERGVELQSLTENINTTTPSGKLTFHLFAALAEFERDLLRQRVNAGLQAARRRGRIGGRPKALGEADLKKARALLRSGDYTKVQVAKELQVSRHTLWRALSQAQN